MDNIIYFIKSTLTSEIASSGFPLIYKGEMNHQIMRAFAFMANRKIAEMDVSTPTRKRIFHIMIECLQNITKHSDDYDEKEKQIGNGLFVVGKERETFYVITGNLIRNDRMLRLEDRLVQLNNATPNQLKKMFLQQMIEGELNEKGGAGLGLIDIARKSKHKLYYHFVPFDVNRHFFILGVSISVDDDDADDL
ncbi:MAG: SiaB family protein kinase [Bacteroidales bacterium]